MLMPGFFSRATQRFETIEEEMNAEGRSRQTTWQYTWMIIGDNPLGGIGYGESQYINTMEEYGYSTEFGRDTLHHPHNAYLQMAVYAGLPALMMFLLANGLLLLQGLLAMRVSHDHQPMILGFVVGLIAFLAVIYPHNHMFVEKVAAVYWVIFGLLMSLATTARATAAVPVAVTSTFIGTPMHPIAPPHTAATVRTARFN
jgi:O-antigen ligase